MERSLKILKLFAVFFIVFTFSFSLVLLPAVKNLNAAGNGIKVFIDAGHGGKDPGAVWNGLNEKDANIAIANKLKAKLEASGFTVIMRRTGDQYHSLDEIVNMANSSGADIFISIHNNASISLSANGTETYWNANGVNGSNQLANLVQSRLLSQIGRTDRGVKSADFKVIKYTKMPAALVECAFVSNPTEAELLKSANFQEKCAVGLFNAIDEFSKGINESTGSYTGGSGNSSAGFTVIIDYPGNNITIDKDFLISGWAADLNNKPPKKLAKVEIYKGLERNESNFLGTASRFDRPDLGRSDILDSGYLLRISLDSLVKGENILYVYAYDVNGNYSYNMVKINIIKDVAPAEQPNSNPTANPGGPYEGTVNQELTFDGSSSADSDGSITEYAWDFGDSSTGTGAKPTHAYAAAGTYTVTLTVKDDKQASSISEYTNVIITEGEQESEEGIEDDEETAENIIPTANPGGPYEGKAGKEITFDGSASADSDGSIAEYLWDFGDSTTGTGVKPTHTYTTAGTYTVTLTVKDDKQVSSISEYTTVIISEDSQESEDDGDNNEGAAENTKPTANPGGPYESKAGKEITFDGSTSADSDGSIAEYLWNFGDNSTGTGVKPTHTYTKAGTYTVTLTVKDNGGAISDVKSATVTVTEEIKDKQEVISREIGKNTGVFTALVIDYPKNNTSISQNFIISGWAADLVNKIPVKLAKVEIYNGPGRYEHNFLGTAERFKRPDLGRKDIIDSGYMFRISLESLLGGENILYVYAYDANNNYIYTSVKINVVKGESGVSSNSTPTANLGGPYNSTVGKEITFDGSASADSDGSITEYLWDFGDGTTGTGVKPTHTYTKAGTYTVTLTVKDNGGTSSAVKTTTATVTEEVNNGSGQGYPVNTTKISNSTNIIGYTEVTVDQLVKIFTDRNSNKADWARRIAPIYIKYGKLFNIRADIAWAMMCHETGFLEYTGDVKPNQNNFSGIGATGGGVPGNSFATEELGIIAHYAHLAWYYYPNHINEYCNKQYDPRHFGSSHYKYTSDTTLGFLNGRWAPGSNYTDKIILYANRIYGF